MKIRPFLLTIFCVLFVATCNADAERDLADIMGLVAKDDGRGEMQVGVIVSSQDDQLCPLLQKTLEQAVSSVCAMESCKKCRITPILRCVQPELQVVLNEAKTLTEKNGVTLLIGPFDSRFVQPLSNYAASASVPVFLTDSPSLTYKTGTAPADNWSFQLASNTFEEFKAFLKAMGPNLERVLVLLQDTPEDHETEVLLRAYATETGMKNILFFFAPAFDQPGIKKQEASSETDGAAYISPVYKAIRGFEAKVIKKQGDLQKSAVVSLLPPHALFPALPEGAQIKSILFIPAAAVEKDVVNSYQGRFRLMASLPPAVLGGELPSEHPCAMAVMRFSLAMEEDGNDDVRHLTYSAILWDALWLVAEALHQECSLPSNKWGTEKERQWFLETLEGSQRTFTGATGRFGFRKGAHRKAVFDTNVIAERKDGAWHPVKETAAGIE